MGSEALIYHKRLNTKIADKKGQQYDEVTRFIRFKLSFLIIKLSLLCIRGSRVLLAGNNTVNVDDDFEYNCFVSKL